MEARFVLALLLIALGMLAYRGLRIYGLRRAARAAPDHLPGYQRGRPAILYFTSPTCQPCRTTQRPVLERVRRRFGERLQMLEVDASRQTRLADAWGVLALPTTFVIDAQGRPRGVNHGVASESRLVHQLAAMGETEAERSSLAIRQLEEEE